ncbi:hypothetical protein KKG24_01475 [Patescibacteria group bacterium]|nr:hypothetical protein [Patescibacteria group bacterium]
MKEIGQEGSIQLCNSSRGLSYRPEFKDWLKKHPRAMSRVASLIEEMIIHVPRGLRDELTEGDIKVIYINKPKYSDVFKVIVGKDKFFVKRDQGRLQMFGVHLVGGQSEYSDSVLVKHQLKDDPDIEVIDFQLGYTNHNDKNPIAYFVSKWEELETVGKYLSNPNLKIEERQEIKNKVAKVRRLFSEFHDINMENMFYNPNTKKIKMFDLNIDPNF